MISNRHPLVVNIPMAVNTAKCIAIISQNDRDSNFFAFFIFPNLRLQS